jgi:hypothetical protein
MLLRTCLVVVSVVLASCKGTTWLEVNSFGVKLKVPSGTEIKTDVGPGHPNAFITDGDFVVHLFPGGSETLEAMKAEMQAADGFKAFTREQPVPGGFRIEYTAGGKHGVQHRATINGRAIDCEAAGLTSDNARLVVTACESLTAL